MNLKGKYWKIYPCPYHKFVRGVEVKLHSFTTAAVDGSVVSASRLDRYNPGKDPPHTLKRNLVRSFGEKTDLFFLQAFKLRTVEPVAKPLYRLALLKPHINLDYISRTSPHRAVNRLRLGYKTSRLMLYRELIAVCSEIHTKHINALCG